MKKGNLIKFLIFLNILLITSAKGQVGFTVTPQLIEMELPAGAKRIFKVLLVNESEKDTNRYLVYPADVMQSERGTYKAIEKGTGKFSCADWLKLDTMEIVLGPKKGKEIPFQIQVPVRVSGGRYCAIVFDLLPKVTPMGEDYAGASVAFHFQIPVHIELTIKSGIRARPKSVEVTEIEVKPATEIPEYVRILKKAANNALVVSAKVFNRDNIHIKAKGRLLLTDKKGRRLREFPLGAGRGAVLPQTEVKFTSVIKRPLAGDYVAEAVINYGGISSAIGRLPFSVARRILERRGSFLATSPISVVIGREVLDLAVPPNSFRTQVLALSNEEHELVKVKTKLKYLLFDENGDIVAPDTGNDKFSCIDWLKVEPELLEIPSGQTKIFKVTFQIPDTNPGGRYACIDMQAMLASAKDTSLPTPIQIPVILSVTGIAEKKIEITKVEVSKGNPPRFAVYLKNLGNIHVKPRVKIELKYLPKAPETKDFTYIGEPKSELVGILGMDEFPVAVLPNCIAKLEQDHERILESGNYMAVVSADFGGTEPAIFIQKFKIK
ncbi:MAG: hypothetical protein ACETVX_02240 [bacterium]